MNIPTLMTKIAAVQGHPIPISSHPAPHDSHDSIEVPADAARQIRPSRRGLRITRNLEFTPGLRMDVIGHTDGMSRPAILYVPGGGFVRAPKVGGALLRRHLAQAGYVVASTEYRTTMTGATYREGVSDVQAAVAYLRANADRFGIDPARIALWGESAGGYLVSMAGLTGEGESRVQAVVNKFGGSDLTLIASGFDERTIAMNSGPHTALARYVFGPATGRALEDDPEAVRAADPASRASAAAPPFVIFHGSADRIISPVQTAHLHDRLRAAGADSTRYLITGAGHGDIAVKGGEEKFWTTEPMLGLATRFLDRVLTPIAAG
ncbi:MAG TPA: alpha/beta hydrolase [Pseudolysinimonas sp.]|jgi:acetyl esterase/lipase|nr:alpha/beta hydrolase [Pseudolysinimonas sp.]